MAQRASLKTTRSHTDVDFIHSEKAFEAILRYERARVDRSGGHFSVVALEVYEYRENKVELKKLVHALQKRIRETDQIGWLDDRTIGILLPGTDLEGAWIFAIKFERNYFGECPPVPFTVYCYPEHWLHNGNGSGTAYKSKYGSNGTNPGGNGGSHQKIHTKVESTLVGRIPAWKRTLDIVGALVCLLLCVPIFLIFMIYIRIVSPGPILFKQKRVGFKGRLFTFLKFRTMRMNNSPDSHRTHLKELINSNKPMEKLDESRDPRIILGGRVIRKTCLDELPQLINVLKGEMSLVGPRPCLPYEAEEFLMWHTSRFDVLPGITGLWQVSGKNKLTFKKMIRLDIAYCQNSSLWLDVKILLRTIPAIFEFVLEAVANTLRGYVKETSSIIEHEQLAICQILEMFAERY